MQPNQDDITIANIESRGSLRALVANKRMPGYVVGKIDEPYQWLTDERPSLELRIDSELCVRVTWLDSGVLVTLEVGQCGVALPNLKSLLDLDMLCNRLVCSRIVPEAIAIEENDE